MRSMGALRGLAPVLKRLTSLLDVLKILLLALCLDLPAGVRLAVNEAPVYVSSAPGNVVGVTVTSWRLAHVPLALACFRNGLLQQPIPPAADYSIAGAGLTSEFWPAPVAGAKDVLVCFYAY
jgi:hypothetical protein